MSPSIIDENSKKKTLMSQMIILIHQRDPSLLVNMPYNIDESNSICSARSP